MEKITKKEAKNERVRKEADLQILSHENQIDFICRWTVKITVKLTVKIHIEQLNARSYCRVTMVKPV